MKYDLNKYTFITYGNTIKAMSTYAGKRVVGIAKCYPGDEFSTSKGMELAGARCNAKVAKKRKNRAARKLIEAQNRVEEARRHMAKMEAYYADAHKAEAEARAYVNEIVESM